MDKIDQIFAQLDDWRHLPAYQLERRADIFFSLYLPKILKAGTGRDINDIVIPEFPLHKKTLKKSWTNQPFRADYFALSKDGKVAFLVELKTDRGSSSDNQDGYLEMARDAGLPALLNGILKIVKADKRNFDYLCKYFYLLKKLEALGLASQLDALEDNLKSGSRDGFDAALEAVRLATSASKVFLICIQPDRADKKERYDETISFHTARKVVIRHRDPVSKRFAEALKAWEIPAQDCLD